MLIGRSCLFTEEIEEESHCRAERLLLVRFAQDRMNAAFRHDSCPERDRANAVSV